MKRVIVLILAFGLAGCSGGSTVPAAVDSASSFIVYDQMTAKFLDENTRHPQSSLAGQVVWNTRYYLESLLTAYEATGNPKYIQAFLDSGAWVLDMVKDFDVLDVPDPSDPTQTATTPTKSVTGWPTYNGTFGQAVAIPTLDGKISLYAQSLDPRIFGPDFLDVTNQPDGSLSFSWWRDTPLVTYTVRNLQDLQAIEAQPLFELPLVDSVSLGRIRVTGLGLPAPGHYEIDNPLQTVWHAEETGGILLPFARFLVLLKNHPSLVSAGTAAKVQSAVLSIATSYEDHFVSDGKGGFLVHHPQWMPHMMAGMYAQPDYIFAEASLRMLLYVLTGDSHHLAIARGLLIHQQSQIAVNAKGWLMLRDWPDAVSWDSKAAALPGSIWDSFHYDTSTPEPTVLGGFFVEMLQVASEHNLTAAVGLPGSIISSERRTFEEYLRFNLQGLLEHGPLTNFGDLGGLMQINYPIATSTADDILSPSNDPFVSADYLWPVVANKDFVRDNWQWMMAKAQNPQGQPIGYFLRAWARSEAAFKSVTHH
jgi:hypothetical protein